MTVWIKQYSSTLKLVVPIFILLICGVFIYGKWMQYEARVGIITSELLERNMDLDKAQSDIVAVIKDSNVKLDKIQKAYILESKRNREVLQTLIKHQEVDAKKFDVLLNLYVTTCGDKSPAALNNKDDKN